jgi:dihydroflavonol-4-reductase
MKVYMTGATGRVGSEVFKKTGAIPLVRRKSGLKNEIITDFSISSLRNILEEADAVLHFAGSLKTWDKEAMREANVSLTWRIVDSTPSDCHVVLAGSVSVYGKNPKELPVTEETPTAPDSDYSRTKLEAEEIVRKKKNHCILRIGAVYGPQFKDYFSVIRMIEKGKMRIFGKGGNEVSFVHAEDVAGVFPKALNKTGTYVVSGPSATQSELYKYAADALEVPPPKSHIPVWAGMLLGRMQEFSARFGKRPTLTREHVLLLSAHRPFDYSKARKELGFSPRPLKWGIEDMVREYARGKKPKK